MAITSLESEKILFHDEEATMIIDSIHQASKDTAIFPLVFMFNGVSHWKKMEYVQEEYLRGHLWSSFIKRGTTQPANPTCPYLVYAGNSSSGTLVEAMLSHRLGGRRSGEAVLRSKSAEPAI